MCKQEILLPFYHSQSPTTFKRLEVILGSPNHLHPVSQLLKGVGLTTGVSRWHQAQEHKRQLLQIYETEQEGQMKTVNGRYYNFPKPASWSGRTI